jgi:hypothetical protein
MINMIMKSDYKTINGVLKALNRASEQAMTVSLAIWFENIKFTLVTKFGYEEREASRFVMGFYPRASAYFATSTGF